MGQAFSRANVAFCRSDIIPDVYNHIGGWDYDRICTAWAGFFTSSEEQTLADGTPSAFVADMAKFQRITGLSKKAAQQLGQVFKIRKHVKRPLLHAVPERAASLRKAKKSYDGVDVHETRSLFPMFEILVVIVVLGDLKRVTKLSLLFSLFSLNDVLSEAEFFLICYFVFRGMSMAVKRPVPGYSIIESLVVSTFDEILERQCSESGSCVRSSSTTSTSSSAASTCTADCMLSKPSSNNQDFSRRSYGRRSDLKKHSSTSEIDIALARLRKMQEEAEVLPEQQSCCHKREMTFKDFLCLTLGPGSALDLIFRGLHGDSSLTIAAHLDFTRSLQFQTRLFQNVFLVQQWLQNSGGGDINRKFIRLTAVLSVCIDLAEKAAEITREIYSVIAADRRMALKGMACVEVPPPCASQEVTQTQQEYCACNSNAPSLAQNKSSRATEQQVENTFPRDASPSSCTVAAHDPSGPAPPKRLPATVLSSLLAEQHIRRQVRHWWPNLRIETTLDDLPHRPRLYQKLMDVFSSRLYGNMVRGSSTLRCRITQTHTLHVRSIFPAGGREPWIEAAVTQGLDTGRGPPVRVVSEADTKHVLADDVSDKHVEELTMELPNVRDNYYLVFTVKSWASDNEVATVGRGSVLLSTFAEAEPWTHTFVTIDPAHSPAATFACEDPQIGCSLLLETENPGEAIECNPLRLNSLSYYIRDVMNVEECALYMHFEDGQNPRAGATHRDINSVALSLGIVYRGKPVAGVIFFPFAENESIVGLTDYGYLKLSFWKNINETHVRVPARPACDARRLRPAFRGMRGSVCAEKCRSTRSDAKNCTEKDTESMAFQCRTKRPSNSSGSADQVRVSGAERIHNCKQPCTQEFPLQKISGRDWRERQLNRCSSDTFRVYSSTANRSVAGSGARESNSKARRYSVGTVCRSGFPLCIPQGSTRTYMQTAPARAGCTLPLGDINVPLRFMCPQEIFRRMPQVTGTLFLAFSTEEERERLHGAIRDPGAWATVKCGHGISSKTACVVDGTAHICCQVDVTDYRCVCGTDAVIRAIGGCVFTSSGEEIKYDVPPSEEVQDSCVFLACSRQILKASLTTTSS